MQQNKAEEPQDMPRPPDAPKEDAEFRPEESADMMRQKMLAGKDLKESMINSIEGSKGVIYQKLVGSKSFKTEATELKDAYIGFYKKGLTTTAGALGKLVRGRIVEAFKESGKGIAENCGNLLKIVTSPSRFAVAGASNVADGVKFVAKMPVKAVKGVAKLPFKAVEEISKGIDKMFEVGKKFQTWNKGK